MAAQTQAIDAQLQEDDVAGGDLPRNDRRFELLPDARQSLTNQIIVILGRHFPQSGQEGVLVEITKIAVRFEEKIYTTATSQV